MRTPVRFLFPVLPGPAGPPFVAPLRESDLKPADEIARGTFLVASPMLRDPNFVRSVVLLCEHTEEGSWGLVVNRRTELTLGDVLPDVPFPASNRLPVLWGGPVETSRMQVLHRLRRGPGEEIEICPDVCLGLEIEDLRDLVRCPPLAGEAIHPIVGHAGWGADQLTSEIRGGAWIVCQADARFVFDVPREAVWEEVLTALGGRFAHLARVPLDPRLN